MRNPKRQLREHSPYELKLLGPNISGLDKVGEQKLDQSQMSISGILATTSRDREGDIFEVSGLDLSNHRKNPLVLLDHGLVHPLPLGKTESPDGLYTVEIDPQLGEVRDTIYLSQHSEVAEQVYHLFVERILRAQSIGYRELQARPLPPDPVKGYGRGKHIFRSELVEASLCGVPANPDCVQATLDKDLICGKRLAPAIKSMLQPYRLPKLSWSPGITIGVTPVRPKDTPTMKKAMSSLNEAEGGALVEEEAQKQEDLSVEEDIVPQEPLGASTLRSLYSCLSSTISDYTGLLPQLENVEVKDAVTSILENLVTSSDEIASIFTKSYPDLDPLAPSDENPSEIGDDEESKDYIDAYQLRTDEVRTDEEELTSEEEKAKSVKTKRFTKQQSTVIQEVSEYLQELIEDESLNKRHKMSLKYLARALKEMTPEPPAVDVESEEEEEPVSPTEQKALLNLERALQRRELQLSRMGL